MPFRFETVAGCSSHAAWKQFPSQPYFCHSEPHDITQLDTAPFQFFNHSVTNSFSRFYFVKLLFLSEETLIGATKEANRLTKLEYQFRFESYSVFPLHICIWGCARVCGGVFEHMLRTLRLQEIGLTHDSTIYPSKLFTTKTDEALSNKKIRESMVLITGENQIKCVK